MHGFLGTVEPHARCREPMERWMSDWLAIEPAKPELRVERAPFRFLASLEPGWDDGPSAQDGDLHLVYTGFIAVDQLGSDDSTIARALLQRYRRDGPEALVGLNGRYVVCVWDAARERLELMNDVLGLKPVFLWADGESFAFGSNVWALACHPRFDGALDAAGAVDLLLLSHQQGNRTLFADVSVLPPGSVTTLQDGDVQSETVCRLEFTRERWNWSIERTAGRMYELLARALERRVPADSRVLLPLSGGMDSRTLMALSAERPVDQFAVTQYMHGALGTDTRLAKKLAARAGVRHRAVPLPDGFLDRYRAKCVSINGGMYDIHTGRFLSLFDLSLSEGRPIVSGHLGGELTGRFHIHDSRFSNPVEHFERAFREENMYRFPRPRLQELLGEHADGLIDRSLRECRRFFLDSGGTHWQRFWNWDLLLYRRRYDAYMLLYFEQFHKVMAPFYDRDFMDFMFSLTWPALERQRAYCEMHRRRWPELAKIPNSNTERPPLVSTRYVLGDFLSTQWRRFVRYPLQRLLNVRRWYDHPCEQMGYALSGTSRPVLDHIMDNLDLIEPHLDPDGVRRAVDRQLEGDNECAMGLLGLSTLVTTLQMLEEPRLALRAWQEGDS